MGVLPASVEAELEIALAAPLGEEAEAALGRAFEQVSWPDTRIVPRREDLSSTQRALLLRLGELDLDLDRFRVPASGAIRQRWLGVRPEGILERKIAFTLGGQKRKEPLWRAVVEARDEPEQLEKILAALSLGDRLRAFGEVNAAIGRGSAYGIDTKLFFDFWDPSLLARLRDEGKDWAPVFADGLLEQLTSRKPGEHHWTLTSDLCWPVFLGLVRARIPIARRWDGLLPMGGGDAFEHCVECVRAIPASRRTAALLGALRRENEPVRVGLPLLAVFPSAELAMLIRTSTAGAGMPKAKILAELVRLGVKHPAIRAAVVPAKRKSGAAKTRPGRSR